MGHLFVIDVGNTSTSVGLARGRRIVRVVRLPTHAPDPPAQIRRALRRAAGNAPVAGAVLCSVVPRRNRAWLAALRRLYVVDALVVSHRLKLSVKVDYPKPAMIGADRLANACAAWERYGRPVIVADFGTALTFDIVTGDGRYVGGVIAPGLPLMTDYLHAKTALLPRISLNGRFGRVGRSTSEAMRIGAIVGYRGMVREILRHVQVGFAERRVALCATGGHAARALAGLPIAVDILPELTLQGLVSIYAMNR